MTEPARNLDSIELESLIPVQQIADRYPAIFSRTTVAWLMRSRDENGLAQAVVRIGRKDFIHKPTFERWLARRAGLNRNA
jgi:hypothetical protein